MSDIFNPVGRVLPGYAGPTVVSGVIADPPRNLAGLAPGTILKGTVLGRGPDGLTTVATDKGTVEVATAANLPAGSTVTLEVRNAGDRLQVLILSVDTSQTRGAPATGPSTTGITSQGRVTGSGVAPTSGQGATPDLPPHAPPPIQFVGSSVEAIVVQTPPAASLLPTPDVDIEPFTAPPLPVAVPPDAAQKAQLLAQAILLIDPSTDPTQQLAPASSSKPTAAAAVPLPPVTSVPASIETTVPPPLTQAAAVLAPEVTQRIVALFTAERAEQPATAALPDYGAVTRVPGVIVAPPPSAKLPPGTAVALQVIAVLANKGGEIEIAPEAAMMTSKVAPVLGKVLGYTPAGHAVIDSPAGALMLQQKTRLPVGAQVALLLEPDLPAPAAALPVASTPQQALLQLSSGWPSLDDVIAILRGTGAPQGQTPPPPPGVPQTGPRLAAGLANAIAALRAGNVEMLLGPLLAGRKIPADKDEAVKRLREEFAQLSSLAQDRPGADWRALFLPVYDERLGLTQINLFYRRGGSGPEQENKDSGTRFVVEVSFAALGAFQLDGLVRHKRFDLMVRSRRALSAGQRREIHAIFEEALALSGGKGGLEFRTMERFPVAPLEELHANAQITA